MNRYFVGILVALGLIIIILVLFTGGSSPKTKAGLAPSLTSYANTDATVSMTINGPITAPQNHNVVVITVGQNSASYTAYQGYNNDVLTTESFPNTENSYSDFLAALNFAGYMKGDTSSSLSNNQGYCATGNNYVFNISQDGKTIQRFWETNCGGVPRSYLGNLPATINLFEAQIPNFSTVDYQIGLS